MAEKAKVKKDNKNLIIGCIAALVLVVAIIITIVVVVNNNSLNDGYFVSDGSKYVLTIEADEVGSDDQYAPLKTHLVYTYDGDKITSMKTYYAYADGDSAKAAFEALKKEVGDEAQVAAMELNGKYIVVTAGEESYKDLTASDVKQQIEFMEKLKNMDSSELDNSQTDADVEAGGTEGETEAGTDAQE